MAPRNPPPGGAGWSMPWPVAQSLEWLRSTVLEPPSLQEELAQWRSKAVMVQHPHVGHNPFAVADQVVAALITAQARRSWQFELNRVPATSLPSAIGRLTALQDLTISQTDCISLPDSMCSLPNLRQLRLSDNPRLTELPSRIGNLRQLTSLSVSYSPLESVPESLGALSNLQRLSLLGGEYVTLPASVGRLKALKELTLWSNPELEYLPDELSRLASLERLDIQSCKSLANLPPLGNLSALKALTVSGCEDLEALPSNLGDLSNLEKLTVANCPNLADLPRSLRWLPKTCRVRVPDHLAGRLAELRASENVLLDWAVWSRLRVWGE